MVNKPNERKQWAAALRLLALCGFLTDLEEIEPGFWAARHTGCGWLDVARELSCYVGGTTWPGKRGVSWVNGRRPKGGGPTCTVHDARDTAKIRAAQRICREIGATKETKGGQEVLPWTIGAGARLLLEWVTPPVFRAAPAEHMRQGIKLGYNTCAPGLYGAAAMYDGAAYYYNLLHRFGSLNAAVAKDGFILRHDMKDGGQTRFAEMMEAVKEEKVLRNSLVGCMMGKRGWQEMFVNAGKDASRKCKKWSHGGGYRPAGLLILRTGVELCQIAALQTDSVYSTIDSVTALCTTKPFVDPRTYGNFSEVQRMIAEREHEEAFETEVRRRVPFIWQMYGIPWEVKAYGRAHICSRGIWRVADQATETYKKHPERRTPLPVASPPLPEVLYHQGWL